MQMKAAIQTKAKEVMQKYHFTEQWLLVMITVHQIKCLLWVVLLKSKCLEKQITHK